MGRAQAARLLHPRGRLGDLPGTRARRRLRDQPDARRHRRRARLRRRRPARRRQGPRARRGHGAAAGGRARHRRDPRQRRVRVRRASWTGCCSARCSASARRTSRYPARSRASPSPPRSCSAARGRRSASTRTAPRALGPARGPRRPPAARPRGRGGGRGHPGRRRAPGHRDLRAPGRGEPDAHGEHPRADRLRARARARRGRDRPLPRLLARRAPGPADRRARRARVPVRPERSPAGGPR